MPTRIEDLLDLDSLLTPEEADPQGALMIHTDRDGHGGGGHTSWHCRTCNAVVYGPPLNTHCTTLAGPANVRISTT